MGWRLCWVLVSALAVAACGGDGADAGDPPFRGADPPLGPPVPAPAPPPASPEGLWVGTLSTGFNLDLVVLENLQAWAVYGAGGRAQGLIQGSLAVDGQAFTGPALRDIDVSTGQVRDTSASGTYTPGSSISGTLEGAAPATFSAAFDARYDVPASTADLVGTWTAESVTPTGTVTNTLLFDPLGAVAGSNPQCTLDGTTVPRPGGKNVFDASFTFSGAGCPFEGETLTGIATVVTAGGTRNLTIAVVRPDRSAAFLATGSR